MKHTSRTLSLLLALLMIFSVTATAAGGNGGGTSALTLLSAKVGDVDLNGASIPGGSEIALTFSNNVTDSSVLAGNISKVKVLDSTGTQKSVTVAPGTDKAVLLVTLVGFSKGAYTLSLGKEITAKNGSTLGTKVEIAFNVNQGTGGGTGGGGGDNPLSFVSAKADGKDLQGAEVASSGTITVTFDRGMTKYQAENFNEIGIYDASGNKASVTFSDFDKDEVGNSYTVVSYSNLAGGTYTLKLGKNLKANNDNTLDKDITISFTVKGAAADSGVTGLIRSFFNVLINFFKSIFGFFQNFSK